MATSPLIVAKKEEEEDPFSFLTDQLPSYDFGGNGFASMEWQSEMDIEGSFFDAFPLMGSVPDPPLYISQDIVTVPKTIAQGVEGCDSNNGGAFIWNELVPLIESTEASPLLSCCKNEEASSQVITKPLRKVTRKYSKLHQENKLMNNSSKLLSRETISQYFYMPITKAAKDLNVGLTLLKKRCRELGIRRWPQRKLMSIQTLIRNIQEMRRKGEGIEERLREAIEVLEQERKLIEERPDMQMDDTTKRLRQACFKANYKKRKLMGMYTMMGPMDMATTSSSLISGSTHHFHHHDTTDSTISAYDEYHQIMGAGDDDQDLEEMISLFSPSS